MQCTSWCTSDKHNPACSVIIDNMSAIYHRRSDWFGQGWSASNQIWRHNHKFRRWTKNPIRRWRKWGPHSLRGGGQKPLVLKNMVFLMFFMVIFPRFFRADAFERELQKDQDCVARRMNNRKRELWWNDCLFMLKVKKENCRNCTRKSKTGM